MTTSSLSTSDSPISPAAQESHRHHIAQALTIAGSDSGGGAGIQADLKTFSALGVYGASVISGLTAQNTQGVHGLFEVSADFVRQQLQVVLDDLRIAACKTGMLARADIIAAVADELRGRAISLVVDPVMIAKSGHALLAPEAIDNLCRLLLPLATLVTPNLPEAAAMTGLPEAVDEAGMQRLGERLLAMGAKGVLIKGGHLPGDCDAVDWLFTPSQSCRLVSPRIATRHTHGTGCTLSAAITAGLACGLPLAEAVTQAKAYLDHALRAADQLQVGNGLGPVHHFHHWWSEDSAGSASITMTDNQP
ncbi:bifunctional hydroxymethylpyrimidine kinase/phosphomethylpyrimidine kinase [Pokkaliibacter sp. MBI-7]|uniref:bifunctional hydroxymethylpyrimidine kinase/phosphomethylpyrimidine kinase n=1 Tax=Pokkaliibacter sp. MBI-7 TaxID=3040600 RepID=UPI00244958C2|nr:bifunctional hydroxymethylpyrimidine kinase/phosphomethylpyrimidine kinase [Pokkaliibacter sp. MBI-7]MDH2431827.1 bifunctional hydroxymethylpyrimidine kinase/phosphomethylpyrimidine kinase [Pokkaliibacter sp. MBI-7]